MPRFFLHFRSDDAYYPDPYGHGHASLGEAVDLAASVASDMISEAPERLDWTAFSFEIADSNAILVRLEFAAVLQMRDCSPQLPL